MARFDNTGECTITTYEEGAYLGNESCSFVIPDDALFALVEEARGKFVPSEQMHDHLKDAIAVRDRLLSIIEKKHERD